MFLTHPSDDFLQQFSLCQKLLLQFQRSFLKNLNRPSSHTEILKSYYNDGIVKPPLYYYRDADKNEIDLLIENGDLLHPIEIKTTSDPAKSMVKAYRCLTKNSDSVGFFHFLCIASPERRTVQTCLPEYCIRTT